MLCGAPKMAGSWWRGLTECGPLEKGMADHFSILALRTHETYEKVKRYKVEVKGKMNAQTSEYHNTLLTGDINATGIGFCKNPPVNGVLT